MAVDSRDDLLSWIGGAIAPPTENREQMSDIILCEAEAVVTVRVPGRVVDVETESTAVRTVVPAPADITASPVGLSLILRELLQPTTNNRTDFVYLTHPDIELVLVDVLQPIRYTDM